MTPVGPEGDVFQNVIAFCSPLKWAATVYPHWKIALWRSVQHPTFTQKYCAIESLVLLNWMYASSNSSRLFVYEYVYLILQRDNKRHSFLWISNLLDISDYHTDAPHQVSPDTKSTMCDWKSMFQCLSSFNKALGVLHHLHHHLGPHKNPRSI